MAATTNEHPWQWRVAIGIAALLFNAGVIVWCIAYGNAENLLHQNALSWSYITSTLVLAGLGFGAVAPVVMAAMATKK